MCSVAIKLGSIIGFIMPSFYVSEDKDYAETREDLWNYTLAQSVVVSIFSIPIFFIIKDKPITPASASAEKQMYSTSGDAQLQDISPEEEIRRSFSKSFDLILSNLNIRRKSKGSVPFRRQGCSLAFYTKLMQAN